MVTTLLSATDRAQIEAAIARIERQSSLEIVVASVKSSADYWQWRVALSGSWALATAAAVLHFSTLQPAWAVFAEVPAALLVYLVFGQPTLRRWLIPGWVAQQAVQSRTLSMFAARGLYRTRDRTGLLILISELERRVAILGDSGLHERIGDSGWEQHIAHIIAKIRAGRAVDGIIEVLERLEVVAREHMPPRADDVNELPDAVVTD
jgi:putative membrane protein